MNLSIVFWDNIKLILPFIGIIFVSFTAFNDNATKIALSQIPVLSYHNVQTKPKKPSDYFIATAVFEKQIKHLKEKGYQTILPDDIFNHHTKGTVLPGKPVMISFDDTRKEHYNMVAPILEKYGFRGAFFIMTVAIGKKNYMTTAEIKMLSDRGHYIGHHTYDHQDLRKLPLKEWGTQIDKPRKKLKDIIGKDVQYLAYPFGLCNDKVVQELKKRNFKGAFQLSGKQHTNNPLFTMRRIIVPGTWNEARLLKELSAAFK